MQISSRFTIAIHILTAIAVFQDEITMSSTILGDSVNANPVVIRRIMLQLSDAGIIHVSRGRGGMRIAKQPEDISFFEVFNAVEALENGELFHFHEKPNPVCPVGRNIHDMLDGKLHEIQQVMEERMRQITLADVIGTLGTKLEEEKIK